MLKIFGHTFNGQGFFIKGFVPNFMAPVGNPLESNWFFPHAPCSMPHAFLASLPNPPGIPITGRADEDIWAELSK